MVQFESGIWAYKGERPAVVMVSSSAVERNAIIGDDLEARKKDIPIVQLNPGGILNFKYKGEMAIRSSGLPYCILRPVGEAASRTIHFLCQSAVSLFHFLCGHLQWPCRPVTMQL